MKKIMFSDRFGLTQAVLSGRKTMTRRIIPRDFFTLQWDEKGDTLWCEDDMGDFIDVRKTRYAQYKVSEVVAIAQSYESIYNEQGLETIDMLVSGLKNHKGWRNKLFVAADKMLHHIRITDVRIERLQDISDEDCKAEGIDYVNGYSESYFFGFGVSTDKGWIRLGNTPRSAYAALIDRVSGKGTWQSNPWVFVYEFELVD